MSRLAPFLTPHFFFLHTPPPTTIYTLSLHDALPISALRKRRITPHVMRHSCAVALLQAGIDISVIRDYLRSEEHTSELQSRGHLVCRLLLEKKKQRIRLSSEVVHEERHRIIDS